MKTKEKYIEIKTFKKLLASKNREFYCTKHAKDESEKRHLPLEIFERELKENKPVLVLE